jgi:hypothetical protein
MAKRGGKRRDPARERFWRRTIQRHERGGLTISAFCRRAGLKDWTFRWCRKELARRDRPTSGAPEPRQAHGPAEDPLAAMFVPMRVVDQHAISPKAPPPIEIVLPTGSTTRVLAVFDPETFCVASPVLEGRRC